MKTSGKLGQRHFTLAKHTAFIAGHGAQCVVVPTLTCPCLTVERQFDPLCTACRGTGRFPQDAAQYVTTLLLTSEDSRKGYHEPGSWVEGTIQATTLPDVRLGDRDLVRLVDLTDTFSDEVLQRGVRDTVRFRAGVVLRRVADLTQAYIDGS